MSAPTNYAGLANKKNQLIRKALTGSAFLAPYSAAPITSLTTSQAGTSGTLSAASLVGATSVSSSVSYPAGTRITIDTSANAETVVTTGPPTGSAPYAIPVPALGKAHASGVAVASLTIGLATLPTGYQDGGWATNDGIALAQAITTSSVSSWGAAEDTRSDITKQETTAKIVLQETKAMTIGLYSGANMTSVVADPTTGEVSIPVPVVPSKSYYRMLNLAVDNSDAGEIYIARFLPKVSVSDKDDQKFSNQDDPIEWGVTLAAFNDSALGYSSRFIFGGPGWAALLGQMGF